MSKEVLAADPFFPATHPPAAQIGRMYDPFLMDPFAEVAAEVGSAAQGLPREPAVAGGPAERTPTHIARTTHRASDDHHASETTIRRFPDDAYDLEGSGASPGRAQPWEGVQEANTRRMSSQKRIVHQQSSISNSASRVQRGSVDFWPAFPEQLEEPGPSEVESLPLPSGMTPTRAETAGTDSGLMSPGRMSDASVLRPAPRPVPASPADGVRELRWPYRSPPLVTDLTPLDATSSDIMVFPEASRDFEVPPSTSTFALPTSGGAIEMDQFTSISDEASQRSISSALTAVPRSPSPLLVILYALRVPVDEQMRRIQDLLALSRGSHVRGFIEQILQTLCLHPLPKRMEQLCFFALQQLLLCHPEVLLETLDPERDISRLLSAERSDNLPAYFLLQFVAYKARYLEGTSNDGHIGEAEAWSMLRVCLHRAGVQDPRRVPPSQLRDWVLRLWYEVPSSRPTPPRPPTHELCLQWINDSSASLTSKEPLFHVLRREIEDLGSPGNGDLWLLGGLLEIIVNTKGLACRDLQHVVCLIPRSRLKRVTQQLVASTDEWPPSRMLALWIFVVVFVWAPTTAPEFLRTETAGYKVVGEEPAPLPFFDFAAFLVRAMYLTPTSKSVLETDRWEGTFNYQFPHSRTPEEIRGIPAHERQSFVSAALLETALMVLAAKASAPINAQDAFQLLLHILVSGPYPLLTKVPGVHRALSPLVPLLQRLNYLYSTTGSVHSALRHICVGLIALLTKAQALGDDVVDEAATAVPSSLEEMPVPEQFRTPSNAGGYSGRRPITAYEEALEHARHRRRTKEAGRMFAEVFGTSSLHDDAEDAEGGPARESPQLLTPQLSELQRHRASQQRRKEEAYIARDAAQQAQIAGLQKAVQQLSEQVSAMNQWHASSEVPTGAPTLVSTQNLDHVPLPPHADTRQSMEGALPSGAPPDALGMQPAAPQPQVTSGDTFNPFGHFAQTNRVQTAWEGGYDYGTWGQQVMAPFVPFYPQDDAGAAVLPPDAVGFPVQQQVYWKLPVKYKDGEVVVRPPSCDVLPMGLKNLGNTCYMNSFLQCLMMTDAFVANIFQFDLPHDKSNTRVLKSMKIVVAMVLLAKKMAVSCSTLLKSMPLEFQSGHQQDTTEAARVIFEALGGHELDLLCLVFAGETRNIVECTACGFRSERNDRVFDFQLHIPTEKAFEKMKSKEKKRLRIAKLFDELMRPDMPEGYRCEGCGQQVVAKKWTEIASPPAHLFVILNRFSWDIHSAEKKKEATHVEVDGSFDLLEWRYHLYACLMHEGASANSGHYWTIARRSEDGDEENCWLKFDDSSVTRIKGGGVETINSISRDERSNATPYCLFYRCSATPPSPPVLIPHEIDRSARKELKRAQEHD